MPDNLDTPLDLSRESSIAAVGSELRAEVLALARVDYFDGFPDAKRLPRSTKRALIRSIFSYVESMAFLLKSNAVGLARPGRLTIGEQQIATERTFDLGDDGKVRERTTKLRTLSNVKFAFWIFAKATDANFELNTSSRGWACLTRAIRVRDRITHPKKLSNLEIEDSEYSDSCRAFIWFDRQVLLALEATALKLGADLQRLRENGSNPETDEVERVVDELRPLRPRYLDEDV